MSELINNDIVKINGIKILKRNGKIYLYVVDDTAIYCIDENTEKILNSDGESCSDIYEKVKDGMSKEAFANLITQLKEANIIDNGCALEKEQFVYGKFGVSALILLIVQDCNLRCSYCYGEGGEYKHRGKMSLETAKRSVDYLFENSGEREDLFITFFGGEPLLRFDFIKEVVEYIELKEKEYNKKVHYSMTCNGTLLTEEISQYIIDKEISVTISIDGNEEVHDFNRYYCDKRGSYNDVIEKTKLLREKTRLTARATLTNKELNVTKIFNDLYSLKFSNVAVAPCIDKINKEEYVELAENYKKLIWNFNDLVKKGEYIKAKKIGIIMKMLKRIDESGSSRTFCGANRNMMAVDIEGNLFPCQRFVGNDKFIQGNVFDGVDEKKHEHTIREFLIDSHDKCTDCWCKNLCGGGCPYENFQSNGESNIPHEDSCMLNKAFFEELIYLYMDLSAEEKENLF